MKKQLIGVKNGVLGKLYYNGPIEAMKQRAANYRDRTSGPTNQYPVNREEIR